MHGTWCTRGALPAFYPPLFCFGQGKQLKEQLREAREGSVRERQKSEQALQRAESRVADLEQAWEVLAAKVVPLADRNADLEWVSTKKRRQAIQILIFFSVASNTTATPSSLLHGAPF